MGIEISFVGETRDRLGESTLWDAEAGALYWVDSVAPCVHRHVPSSGDYRRWDLPEKVGSVGLAAPGSLLVAMAGGFHLLDLATGGLAALALPEAGNVGVRFNDGKMDRQGRYLCGTLETVHTAPLPDPPLCKLYRLDHDGRTEVLETGVRISNATCFSPDGRTLYYADSLQGAVWAYDYDTASGRVRNRRVFADTMGAAGSAPDGATVDAEGHVWVALVQAGALGRFAPDGSLVARIAVPIPFPTCPAFGGAGLDVLYCSAISNSGARLSTDHPDGGRLMRIEGTGVRGIAEPRFRLGAGA